MFIGYQADSSIKNDLRDCDFSLCIADSFETIGQRNFNKLRAYKKDKISVQSYFIKSID